MPVKYKLEKFYRLLISGLLVIALLLSQKVPAGISHASHSKTLSGFKDIQFDLNLTDLKNLGLTCTSWTPRHCNRDKSKISVIDELTFLGQPLYYNNDEGLFGQGIVVWLSDEDDAELINQITILVGLTGKTVSNSLTQSLGVSVSQGEWDYWFFKNGAAIGTYNPNERLFPGKTIYYAPKYSMKLLANIMPTTILSIQVPAASDDY